MCKIQCQQQVWSKSDGVLRLCGLCVYQVSTGGAEGSWDDTGPTWTGVSIGFEREVLQLRLCLSWWSSGQGSDPLMRRRG